MAKIKKSPAELHALLWDHLGVPASNRGPGQFKIYPMNDTWRAMSTAPAADNDFRNNVIAISIILSEKYDLAQ